MPADPPTLDLRDLNRALLERQMLLERRAITVDKVLRRLVGLQAQQVQPPFVGLWSRIADFEAEALRKAIVRRKVVKVTSLRGTLHLMRARDYLELFSTLRAGNVVGARSVLGKRIASIDIPKLCKTAAKLLVEQPRTFTELRKALVERYPEADPRAMGYLVRTHVPLVQLPTADSPWAHAANAEVTPTTAWLDDEPDPGDARESLVRRYLAAFGPATPADAQTWSGLQGLRETFESMKLRRFRDGEGRELFDLPRAPRPAGTEDAPIRYIAGFDNLVLAHADRRRIVAEEHRKQLVTKNLLVKPTILIDGFVAGTWKVEQTRKRATLTVEPFAGQKLGKSVRARLGDEGEALLAFLAPELDHAFTLR